MTDPRRNLLDSTRRLLDTALGLLQTRIALLSTEIEEEKARLLRVWLFGTAAMVLLSFGVVLLAFLVVFALGSEYRLLAVGVLGTGFLLAGITALLVAMRNARRRTHRLLAATIDELEQDRGLLNGKLP